MTQTRTRAAIVGTAESWKRAPWNDPTITIVGLNDAYALGFPRADEWYELHPLDHMYFRDPRMRIVKDTDIPPGHYVRPAGHLERLRETAKAIPVWLQKDPPAGWPANARALPLAELEAKYGTYWASGPAYELMHLYERGFREIHIYGIHLATDAERVKQRHNFEFLIGRLLGPHMSMSVDKGLRTYDGETGVRIVLPVESPILQHGWKYAFEPQPIPPVDPLTAEWKQVQKEKQRLIAAIVNLPKGKDKRPLIHRLQRIEVIEADIQAQIAKRQIGGTLAISLG